MSTRSTASAVERLLADREIVVACGPGGVGKTTTSAAVAASAAVRSGAKVLVLTVDPAKRLADALGIAGLGNAATRIPASAFAAAGVRPKGALYAAMLDTKQSWDDLIRRQAPDASTAAQILANPLYQNISGRFAQSHEYIAMERLFEIHAEGAYDLLVVDTPPTRNALDFLDAPERMAEFFASGLLRWLIAPSRSRFVSLASKPFYQVADRILGTQFLEDVAEFFLLFQSMYDGFVTRARAVSGLLRDPRTTFMVVTTLETAPAFEAARFSDELVRRRLHLGLIVVNKALPASFVDPQASYVAELLQSRAAAVAPTLTAHLIDAAGNVAQVERVLQEVGRSFANFELVARREAETLERIAKGTALIARVPHLSDDVGDLEGLLEIGRYVFEAPRDR